MDLNATVQLIRPEGQTWPFSTYTCTRFLFALRQVKKNIIIQHNIWKSGIIPVPLTTGQQSAFYDCLKYSDFGIL